MLRKNNQLELNFSKYFGLYDMVIKPENFWKQLNDMVDFSVVYKELKDNEDNLMDKLINKTVEIALEKGLIEVKSKIIVDSTHTNAMFQHISQREELIRQAKCKCGIISLQKK